MPGPPTRTVRRSAGQVRFGAIGGFLPVAASSPVLAATGGFPLYPLETPA